MALTISPERIRAARISAGMSLEDAARRVPAARGGIHNYETGRSVPGANVLGRMAAAYGVDITFFYVDETEGVSADDTRGGALIGVRGASPDHEGE